MIPASYLYPNSEWKLNFIIIKTVAKKKKKSFNAEKAKRSRVKKIKRTLGLRIRLGNNRNHVILIIQKSFLLLN